MIDDRAHVRRNIAAYARAHRRYERNHVEIFNPVEQTRLRQALCRATASIATAGTDAPRALDLGCGSGNLTAHLLDLGCSVVAADVSPAFLKTVRRRFGERVETLQLNGLDLREIPAGHFDLVGAYSVLHHVPDYLGIVGEMARVLAPGGVVFLDHEVNENFWMDDGCVAALRREIQEHLVGRPGFWNPARRRWQRFLIPSKYILRARMWLDPGYPFNVEGDIHTWPGDHIEWDLIEGRLNAARCELIEREDYLLYDGAYPREVYDAFKGSCTDMAMMVARKTAECAE